MSADVHLAELRQHAPAWDVLRRPVWVFDPQGLRGLYANPAALSLWDADSLPELLARDFAKLSPAALARTARLVEATLNGDEVVERWTFYPKGRPVTVQATISTLRVEPHRAVLLFEASPLEVEAEERRAVEALRHASTLITLFNEDGRPAFSNPAAYSAYGLDAGGFDARFKDPDHGRLLLIQALAGETVSDVCEMTTMRGDRWHHLDAHKVLDPVTGCAGVLLNEVDVTRRVHAEQAWAAAEQRAAMADARQTFLTEMSHDLRTPLNAVIGFSALLGVADLAPEQIEQAACIHEAGHRLLAVVEDMIRLPGVEDDPATEPADEPEAPAGGGPLHAPPEDRLLRVLYVDDNATNRALVRAILKSQGIDCQTADDGGEGYEAAKATSWDLILMDIQMPVMDGIEATRAIRASGGAAGATPIIAVTANTLSNQLESYRDAGMNDCIAKPIEIATLLHKIELWGNACPAGPAPHISEAAEAA